jgi:formiminotetrahydrofolate cyclodeaminase
VDIASLTIDEFLSRLGSSDPTPGGGALAALSGAMAAAMLAMTCNLTLGRPRYADVEPQVRDLLANLSASQSRLLALANADADAYQAVRDAYALPRGDEAERALRADAIESSMHAATEVPIDTLEASRRVLDHALLAAGITNTNILGDVAVAAHLALAAARGAADQARLNIASLHDRDFASSMERRLHAALGGSAALVDDILIAIANRTASA